MKSSNDHRIWRELDKKLFLIVKQKFDKGTRSSPWILPQEMNKEGESLKEVIFYQLLRRSALDILSLCFQYIR